MSHAQTYVLNTSLFSLHAGIYEYIKIYINYYIFWYLHIFLHLVSNQDHFYDQIIIYKHICIYKYISQFHESYWNISKEILRHLWVNLVLLEENNSIYANNFQCFRIHFGSGKVFPIPGLIISNSLMANIGWPVTVSAEFYWFMCKIYFVFA